MRPLLTIGFALGALFCFATAGDSAGRERGPRIVIGAILALVAFVIGAGLGGDGSYFE